MFSDLLDMTLSYIQYITLLLRLDPYDVPDFYTEPFKVLRYIVFDTSSEVSEDQRYNNYLRVNLPDWLPLDIRLQYVCIAVIGPMVVTTFGMLFVYGKPAYIWFICALGTLFMFLFGFILLANMSTFLVPGAQLPSKSTLSILGGVGLPCFLLLLAGGLLGMGRARLQLLRQDAVEMEHLIEEERRRRQDQRVTQQMVDREGIDLVAVAAEQVHAKRDQHAIDHADWYDIVLQGLFVVVLFVGSLILLNAIKIPQIADMQTSIVFKVIGAIGMVVWGFVTFWWVLSFFKQGRELQKTISDFVGQRALGLVVTVCNVLYINVVTNFISILYCVTLKCDAGTRTPFSASLFPSILDFDDDGADVISGATVGCMACDYQAYPQHCSAAWQSQLCTSAVQQRRLVYDPRVQCDDIDAFFKVSGCLIFATYLIFLPYLQFYMAQYTVQVLKESYPLEQRYYDVFTAEEIYFQKVLSSQNNAAFAYRAYKPQFRFYRLSFLLQKVVLGVVGCVMREGLSHDVAWAGMIFFLVVPIIALSCSLYLKPFSRQVEAYFFVAVQAMVSVCAVVCLAAQQSSPDGVPNGVWIVLMVLLIAVPICTLVVGNALTLREERRWTELWQQRLVEGVTAAYETTAANAQNPLDPTSAVMNTNNHNTTLVPPSPSSFSPSKAAHCDRSATREPGQSTTSSSDSSSSSSSSGSSTGSGSGRPSHSAGGSRSAGTGSTSESPAVSQPQLYTHHQPLEVSGRAAQHTLISPLSASYSETMISPTSGSALRRRHHHSNGGASNSHLLEDGRNEMAAAEGSQSVVVLPSPTPKAKPKRQRSFFHTSAAAAVGASKKSAGSGDDNDHRAHDGDDDNDDAASLPGGNTTTAAIANLRALRAFPRLLQADTWGDSMRLVLRMAGQTIAAPFSHFNQHVVVVEGGGGGGSAPLEQAQARRATLEEALNPNMPQRENATAAVEVDFPARQRRSSRSGRVKKDKDSGSSEENGEIVAKVVKGKYSRDVESPSPPLLLSSGTYTVPALARTTDAASPSYAPHRPISGFASSSYSDPQRSTSAASRSLPSALAATANAAGSGSGSSSSPSARRRRSSLAFSPSASITPNFGGLPIANPLGGHGAARLRQPRGSLSFSPGTSMMSPSPRRVSASASALITPPACVIVPSAAKVATPQHPSPSKQQRRTSLHHTADVDGTTHPGNGDVNQSDSNDTTEALLEDVNEYAEDATQAFIPALYFTQRARARWQTKGARGRRSSVGVSLNGTLTQRPHSGDVGHPQHPLQATSLSLTQELRAVPLPWRRLRAPPQPSLQQQQQSHEEGGEDVSDQPGHPVATALHSTQDSLQESDLRDGGAAAAAGHARAQDVSSAAAAVEGPSLWATLWRLFTEVDDDAAKRRRYVLSFTDVYVRRQLFLRGQAHAAGQDPLADADHNDHSSAHPWRLSAAQLRHCAQKAFWGCPTDAMLGVVEVPGSMPPWGLYCHAPPPPIPPPSPSSGGADPSSELTHRPMYALQRQYYAQLAEEQRRAALRLEESKATHHKHGKTLTRGSQAHEHTSLTATPPHTSLSQYTSFRFPLPMHPLRAAAYERQAAAIRAYHDESDEQLLLPLDSELDSFGRLAAADADDDDETGNVDGAGEDVSTSTSRSPGRGPRRASGTLHWLEQWGPVLTELLYEAAVDDNRRSAKKAAKAAVVDSSSGDGLSSRSPSSNSSSSSSSLTSRSSSSSSSMTGRSPGTSASPPRSRGSKHKTWRSWLPWTTSSKKSQAKSKKKKAKRSAKKTKSSSATEKRSPNTSAETRSEAAVSSSVSTTSRSHKRIHVAGQSSTSPSVAGVSSSSPMGSSRALKRHHSTLLTLITGTQTPQSRHDNTQLPPSASSRLTTTTTTAAPSLAASTESSDVSQPLPPQETLVFDVEDAESIHSGDRHHHRRDVQGLNGRSSRRAVGDDGPADMRASTATTTYRDPFSTAAPTAASAEAVPSTGATGTAPYTTSGEEGVADAAVTAVPQDPLIQQLRCLHLVRQRLKESYWEHRDQLKAVQEYIDYEINETMRRVLTFLFIVVGTVATVSFTLALLGMMHTLDWRFISGVRKSETNLRYELAGYDSWESFTENCCCMAATDLDAAYPYYALDVENWVCANGVTKERVRRDGYDEDVVDGYAVRALCGMEFKNGCELTVDAAAQTVTLGGCNSAEVTSADMLRW